MKILGISAFYHDSAAAIIEDGAIIAAAVIGTTRLIDNLAV